MKRLTRDILFDSEHLGRDLARKSIRGGMTTMTAQGIQFVLNLAGTIVLARLLTPNDYGLIGMVMVIVNFATMFKDAGLSMATVQKEEISHEQISTLFWINVLISVALGLCVLAASPLVAMFYGKPELTTVTAALSLSFLISGLTIQHQALLRRHMRFGTLAVIRIVSYAIHLIVAILLALVGWRYWALVGGSLATALSGTLLTLFFCPWIPGRMKKGTGVRGMLKFGGYLTGFNFVNYFARNADNLLIGKFIGADALGLYAKAYQLFMLPITQIRAPLTAVVLPVLSRLQNEPDKCAKYYYRLVSMLSFITMPIMGFLFVCSESIVRLLLGEKWLDANVIFKILAVAGFIQAVETTGGLIMLSTGQSRRFFTYGAIRSAFLVGCFVIGLPWGVCGVAAGFTIGDYLILFPALWYCFRGTPVSVAGFLLAIAQPTIAGLISTGVMYFSYESFLIEQHDFVAIGICLLVGLLSYLGVWAIIPGGLTTLREFTSYLPLLFRNKNNRQQAKSPAVVIQ